MGQFLLHQLIAGDRLPELHTLSGVLQGIMVTGPGMSKSNPGNTAARHVQNLCGIIKSMDVGKARAIRNTYVRELDVSLPDRSLRGLTANNRCLKTRHVFFY